MRTRQRSAEETCVGELDEAGSIGERNDSGWKKFLAKASSVLKIVGLVLLVIAVIAIVTLTIMSGGGLLIWAGAVFGSSFGTAMTVVAAATIAVDTTRRLRNDEGAPSWGSLAFDTALTVGPGALAKGAKALGGADDAMRGAKAVDDAARAAGGADDAGRSLTEGSEFLDDSLRMTDQPLKATDEVVVADLPKVNGRKIINSDYAGKKFTGDTWTEALDAKYPDGVVFKPTGYPKFTPYAIDTVKSPTLLTGDVATDIRALGKVNKPGFTWHHVEDGFTMELVPAELHDAVKHTGGRAVAKHLRSGGGT